ASSARVFRDGGRETLSPLRSTAKSPSTRISSDASSSSVVSADAISAIVTRPSDKRISKKLAHSILFIGPFIQFIGPSLSEIKYRGIDESGNCTNAPGLFRGKGSKYTGVLTRLPSRWQGRVEIACAV